MGSNGDILIYYITLSIREIDESFIYEVGLEEIDRLKDRLSLIPENDLEQKTSKFFCFRAVNNISIAVSLNDIQWANFLWEKASNQNSDIDNSERRETHFYFRHKPHRYSTTLDKASEAAALYFQLELGEFEETEFYSFLDVDGEEVLVRLNDIVLVEFDSLTLDEGFEELKNEMTE
ncbi:MAG: hypothetical protein ACE5IR_02610 [bacterium]